MPPVTKQSVGVVADGKENVPLQLSKSPAAAVGSALAGALISVDARPVQGVKDVSPLLPEETS